MRKIACVFAVMAVALAVTTPSYASAPVKKAPVATAAHNVDLGWADQWALSNTRYACDSGSNFGWSCEWWAYSHRADPSPYTHVVWTKVWFRQRICLYHQWYLRYGTVEAWLWHDGSRWTGDRVQVDPGYATGIGC